MFDLFGNYNGPTETKKKTFEEEYSEYINFLTWKRIRTAKLKDAGEKCERCGLSKWSVKLEVHHKDYKHFKRERLQDLEVLCSKCHLGADEERKERVEEKWEKSPLVKGFERWMDEGNNSGWRGMGDGQLERHWQSFLACISTKKHNYEGKPFRRKPSWY